jgi:hypothetical protein
MFLSMRSACGRCQWLASPNGCDRCHGGGGLGLDLVDEDGFDGGFEETGEFEGQGEAGIVLAGLNGVDGLAGDLEAFGEVGLGPVAFGAEDAESVVHVSDTVA